MTRSEHIRALMEEYEAQRQRNARELDARTAKICADHPEIAALREESAALALTAIRSILAQQTPEARQAEADAMKRRGREIHEQTAALLKAAGLPEDALSMRYRCAVCRDTGYVGDAPARFCDCFEARLRRRMHEDGTMAGVEEQNFARFDAGRVPEEDGQRAQLLLARRLCEDFADSFPDTRYRNILLTGAGGLGKTFLLNCVFERVTARGGAAIRVTSFRMFEAMRRQHVGNDADFTGFSDLLETPLLLIDDLGAEPMMRNITVEYLFTLLNERMAAGRHTVVATNLSPAQLLERYGERVSSRLLDRAACAAIQLKGKDLRRL